MDVFESQVGCIATMRWLCCDAQTQYTHQDHDCNGYGRLHYELYCHCCPIRHMVDTEIPRRACRSVGDLARALGLALAPGSGIALALKLALALALAFQRFLEQVIDGVVVQKRPIASVSIVANWGGRSLTASAVERLGMTVGLHQTIPG